MQGLTLRTGWFVLVLYDKKGREKWVGLEAPLSPPHCLTLHGLCLPPSYSLSCLNTTGEYTGSLTSTQLSPLC